VNKITTIRATESMKDNLVKEVIRELNLVTLGTEVEAVLVIEVSRQREVIRATARTVVKITKSPNLQSQTTIG
jgi:hypothetical protein